MRCSGCNELLRERRARGRETAQRDKGKERGLRDLCEAEVAQGVFRNCGKCGGVVRDIV